MFSFNPHDYRCCQHNVAFGWPYFSEHLWMATPGHGLAAVFYAPNSLTAKVSKGTTVKIAETTDYPFGGTVHFALSSPKAARFPLVLRVPGWCRQPKVTINGKAAAEVTSEKGWITLDRSWKDGDKVDLELPMEISAKVWDKNKNAVSVQRGPLTYALKIGERWERYGGTDRWPAFEVFPTTPWGYGLIVDLNNPASSFEVVRQNAALPAQPFSPEAAPIFLKAKGKRIPQWKQETNGLVGEIQESPARSAEPVESITLIPMGCARLRIAAFPQIGEGAAAHDWKQALK